MTKKLFDLVTVVIPKDVDIPLDIREFLVGLTDKVYEIANMFYSNVHTVPTEHILVGSNGHIRRNGEDFRFTENFLRAVKISRVDYKVGDIVKIKKRSARFLNSLERLIGPDTSGGFCGFNKTMETHCGKMARVTVACTDGSYYLENIDGTWNGYSWRDFWLIPKRIKKA